MMTLQSHDDTWEPSDFSGRVVLEINARGVVIPDDLTRGEARLALLTLGFTVPMAMFDDLPLVRSVIRQIAEEERARLREVSRTWSQSAER